jgi:hypothetical protein
MLPFGKAAEHADALCFRHSAPFILHGHDKFLAGRENRQGNSSPPMEQRIADEIAQGLIEIRHIHRSRYLGIATQQVAAAKAALAGAAGQRRALGPAVADMADAGALWVRAHVPASAILTDINGGEWVYVETAPRQYERRRVEVTRIIGGRAMLARGLASGVRVVTAYETELLGTLAGRRLAQRQVFLFRSLGGGWEDVGAARGNFSSR